MKLAIKGHSTRGRDIIQLLEMLGGRNSNNCTGQYINRIYFINKNGYIESTDDIKLQLYCATHNLEEFEEKFPYKVGDMVVTKYCPTMVLEVTQMQWNDAADYIVYSLNNQAISKADDLQSYKNDIEINKEPEPKAPILSNRYDYTEGKCGYVIPDGYEFDSIREGFQTEIILKPKKPTYPKDFEECAKIMQVQWEWHLNKDYLSSYEAKLDYKIHRLKMLLICRDAYWKIAGEQMGLGKPWEPDWSNGLNKCCLLNCENRIIRIAIVSTNTILVFPTEEMRDAFYENFKDLINECKDFI